MKKTLFAIVSLAVLAMGCVKEQQPSETPAEANPVSTIRISVAPTKVAVNETTGACTWQENDQIAVWFANADATAGQRVVYTFKTVLSDGSAEFETSETITEGYAPAKVTYPAECLNEEGGWGLIRNWEYKEGFIPMYARTETITVNDDGSLSAQLYHNASVFKFTLHDIPAYAAGFVLEAVKYNKNGAGEFVDADGNVIDKENATPSQTIAIKTSFPYKTGYTANPADNSNDITLYSVAAHGSYLTRVYLVDGDGSVIEGSEKKIKQSWNDVSTDNFIEFPRIDFKKADLRKDFVKVCGIKWAKGNLQCYQNNGDAGFQNGWRIAPTQWHHFNYDLASNTVGVNTYTYDDTKATEMSYQNDPSQFEHYNFGGLARNARFYSSPGENYMVPGRDLDISGKIFEDSEGNVEATGEERFVDCGTFTSKNSAIWGDLAFWASKGKFRTPTKEEISALYDNPKVSKQFGYYDTGDYKVWGVLFTASLGEQVVNTTDVELTDADLESGLFLPKAGRRKVQDSKTIISMRLQGLYRSSSARWADDFTNHATILQLKPTAIAYGYTVHKTEFTNATGGLIRPVLAE